MSAAADIVIDAKDLKLGYGDKVLLEKLNFQVRRGEVFIILGGSGCGKSTLLKHLIGLYPPMSGEIWFGPDNLVTAQGDERQRVLRKFGVMYQSGALFGSMTVLENVRLPLDEFTDLPDQAKELIALTKLKLVVMESAANKMPADLSGGMQKRAAIARAMALDPGILFLDEPSAGLDPITSAGLDALIKDLSRDLGITFVIVTHELQSIFAVADRVIMLDAQTRGIIGEGKPAELRDHSANPWVRQFFNREAELPKAAGNGKHL
jgi:phospholipid/cholesterol/gamma-HCH transport system ATP-binding protein